jgi:hypothetical protein
VDIEPEHAIEAVFDPRLLVGSGPKVEDCGQRWEHDVRATADQLRKLLR